MIVLRIPLYALHVTTFPLTACGSHMHPPRAWGITWCLSRACRITWSPRALPHTDHMISHCMWPTRITWSPLRACWDHMISPQSMWGSHDLPSEHVEITWSPSKAFGLEEVGHGHVRHARLYGSSLCKCVLAVCSWKSKSNVAVQ